MDRPTCKSCPFWNYQFTVDGNDRPIEQGNPDGFAHGDCQRFPPQLRVDPVGAEGDFLNSKFPSTMPSEWCGEHPEFNDWVESQAEAVINPCRQCGRETHIVAILEAPGRGKIECDRGHICGFCDIKTEHVQIGPTV